MEWMEQMKVVGNDSKLQAWLAFGFLMAIRRSLARLE